MVCRGRYTGSKARDLRPRAPQLSRQTAQSLDVTMSPIMRVREPVSQGNVILYNKTQRSRHLRQTPSLIGSPTQTRAPIGCRGSLSQFWLPAPIAYPLSDHRQFPRLRTGSKPSAVVGSNGVVVRSNFFNFLIAGYLILCI